MDRGLAVPTLVGGEAGYLSLLAALAVVLLAAKVLGEIAIRLGQPAVLGELVAGLALGPTLIDILSLPPFRGEDVGLVLHQLGQLGALMLMLSAGMEIELTDLRRSGRPASYAGVLGVVAPILMGGGLGLLFGLPPAEAVFIGIILSATSVSISAQTLMDMGRLRSREGVTLLGAAVIDDILVLISLSVFFSILGGGAGVLGILGELARMVLVLVLALALSVIVLPRLAGLAERMRVSQAVVALSLVGMLFLGWATEFAGGLAAITGAFIAGLGLGRTHLREEIERGIRSIAYGLFVPLFLVDIGMQANLRILTPVDWLFGAALIIVAIVSKVLGAGLGARWGGFDARGALRLGVGMISRGEVGLIVAAAGLAVGVAGVGLFNQVLLMVLVTTLITPPMLKAVFPKMEAEHAPAD
jgi:Kef-type K+ transport system membrane component KefB